MALFFALQAIKDMDYIIKEKTLLETIFQLEINQYLSESKLPIILI